MFYRLFRQFHFPKIVPYHPNIKEVASFFNTIEGQKCLRVKDISAESALFYSNAIQIYPLNTLAYGKLDPFLIDDVEFIQFPQRKILFEKGDIKLIKL